MADTKVVVGSRGITLFGLMFIVFLVLKLAEIGAVATWSWWWVTAPLWMPACFVLGIIAVVIVIAIIVGIIKVFAGK